MKEQMRSLAASFEAAGNGILWAIKNERNMRIHTVMLIYVIFFGFLGRAEVAHWAIFFLCFAAVITSELVNTALEKISDMVCPDFNPKIGIIKDVAAGAVLVSAICAATAGLCIFLSPTIFGNVINALIQTPWLIAVIAISLIPAFVFVFRKPK